MHNFQLRRPSFSTQRGLRGFVCVALCALLVACGFKLRGTSPLPFDTLYTNIAENSEFGAQMRRAIEASSPNTRFVDKPADAQAKLIQLANNQSLREVSINAQGLVEEYELNLSFVFELIDAKGHILLPPTTLNSSQDMPYDPNAIQAKQGEIGTMFKQMQKSLVDRVVRRLSSPDVTEAAKNLDKQPIEENPNGSSRYQNPPKPTPWITPRISPGTGLQ